MIWWNKLTEGVKSEHDAAYTMYTEIEGHLHDVRFKCNFTENPTRYAE